MITIRPGSIKGNVNLPPSKSMSIRALACSFLSGGEAALKGAWPQDASLICEDIQAAYRVVKTAGEKFMKENFAERKDLEHHLRSLSLGAQNRQLDCGESALAIRMFAPIMALSPHIYCLRGRSTLLDRPMDFVVSGLRSLGCWCEAVSKERGSALKFQVIGVPQWGGAEPEVVKSRPILLVQGPLKGGHYRLDAGGSSQFVSGLLMALPLSQTDSTLEITGLESRPYIDLTIDVMRRFGVQVSHDRYTTFSIPGRQHYAPTRLSIEGDWSGAANFVVAGALCGSITIGPLWYDSLQADKAILRVMDLCRVPYEWQEGNRLLVHRAQHEPEAFEFDATACPDIFPPLTALACNCVGTSRIHGVSRLFAKESNRALSLLEEFSKMGAEIRIEENDLVIVGGPLKGGCRVWAHEDNRIAMACAVAALRAAQPVEIEGRHTVRKSFPEFWNILDALRGE